MGVAQSWLDQFESRLRSGQAQDIAAQFAPQGFWRDYLPFGWTLQTLEGRDQIGAFGAKKGPVAEFSQPKFEGEAADTAGHFRFQTKDGPGRGYIRFQNGQCQTLFTMLESFSAEPRRTETDEPFVLVVGGGQGGLALGAQLQDLGVPYLIVDAYPRVGDQWRSRYESLVLHDPVWYDHLPFKPFPEDWPVFTPKDMMGDWLESYASELGLNIQTSTKLVKASYDPGEAKWTAELEKGGSISQVRPTHLVMALGLSGFPHVPEFAGQEAFDGPQMHSSAYKGGADFAGKDVVVVGANNSAHDIATDLVRHGARPVLVQRSSTLVVDQTDYCERILGPLYSAEAVASGITTDKADILQASMPLKMMEPIHKRLWDGIRADRAGFYQRLTDAGFAIDFAEDGTGLGMKYRRTASGYYIDVGGAQMVMEGQIAVRSGHGVSHLSEHEVHLESGEALQADGVVYATGYGDMTDWVAALIDRDTADRVGPCWGYGSGTRGDPGPWIGEQRNMWVETKQDGLWFTGGNLSQARYFSRLLALQLARAHRT
ncbi:MAG: NAD(P)/FAD-dependent oxidoreductase [Pseudomonadota bacterium]